MASLNKIWKWNQIECSVEQRNPEWIGGRRKLVEDGGVGPVVVRGGVRVGTEDDVAAQDVGKKLSEDDIGKFGRNNSLGVLKMG